MKKILTKDEVNNFISEQLNIINEQRKEEDKEKYKGDFISDVANMNGKFQILTSLTLFINDYQ